jgi:DNA-binding SARP family transcriptional activator
MDRTTLALRVDVLGPLVLRVRGAAVDVVGSRRRAVLALLALEGVRGLSTERLVDSLWPDDPPENAVQALYSHVHRLRRHLGPLADRLERQANGYRLRLEPFEVDADAARRLASSDPHAALELWRGPALVEFRSLPASGRRDLEYRQLPQPAHLQRPRGLGGRPQQGTFSAADLPSRHGRR